MVRFRVLVRALTGEEMLPETTFEGRRELLARIRAAIGHRPSFPVQLLYQETLVKLSKDVATIDGVIELTAVVSAALTSDERDRFVATLRVAEHQDQTLGQGPFFGTRVFHTFRQFPSHARDDATIVGEAVGRDGECLAYASTIMRSNKVLVLKALRRSGGPQNTPGLQYASDALKHDKGLVLFAVGICGRNLEHACAALRADKEIVIAAVQNNPNVLRFASKDCQTRVAALNSS